MKEDFGFVAKGLGMAILFLILIIGFFAIIGYLTNEPGSQAQNNIQYDNMEDRIIADDRTHVMYYRSGDGDLCPYYSNNGKLCIYENGKIIEVNANEESN